MRLIYSRLTCSIGQTSDHRAGQNWSSHFGHHLQRSGVHEIWKINRNLIVILFPRVKLSCIFVSSVSASPCTTGSCSLGQLYCTGCPLSSLYLLLFFQPTFSSFIISICFPVYPPPSSCYLSSYNISSWTIKNRARFQLGNTHSIGAIVCKKKPCWFRILLNLL